jgi:hypothetical protein
VKALDFIPVGTEDLRETHLYTIDLVTRFNDLVSTPQFCFNADDSWKCSFSRNYRHIFLTIEIIIIIIIIIII